tara:strand:- start:1663 stop:2052 length:390 start_codon:yes stop_codon:yes gene_type:complete
MLNKQEMNMIERLREHGYECNVSPEGVIINSKIFGNTHEFMNHQDKGSDRIRTMICILQGIGQSYTGMARKEATKALKLIEVFINDHYDKGEENLELSRARDCIIEVIEKTTSIEKDNESIKWIDEDNQ